MGTSNMMVSAHIVCYINGQKIADANSFTWTSETPHREIMAIDFNMPFELAPGATRMSGQIGLYRKTLEAGAEGKGMVSDFNTATRDKYFTIALVDRVSNTMLFKANNCSVNSQSWNLPTRGRVSGTVSFSGITWSNEANS